MRPLKWMLKLSMAPMFAAICACSTLEPVRVAQIPLRQELRQCEALSPIRLEALPQLSEEPAVRAAQLAERGVFYVRDIAQADVLKDMCNKLAEVVSLVDANNAGPEN